MGIRQGTKTQSTAPRSDATLSACDLEMVNAAHDEQQRLARALLLLWARADPMTATHPTQLSEALLQAVSAQLGIDPETLPPCKGWLVFHHADVKAVQSYLHLRALTAEETEHLRSFLAAQVPRTANTHELIQAAYGWLAEQHILRPIARTVIQRIVYQVRHEVEEHLFQSLAEQLSQEQRDRLDDLCQARQGRSLLATLVTPPHSASNDAIRDEARRLELIRDNLPTHIDWLGIQQPRLWQWAAIVRRLSAQALRRYPAAKRYALLLAFLTVRGPEVTDAIVDMFDALVARLFARSTAELREAQMEQAQSQLSSARLFRRITQVLLDAKVPPHTVRDHIFQQVSREQVNALVKRSESLEEGEAEALFALLKSRFSQARELARVVVGTLHFCAANPDSPLLAGVHTLREMDAERRKKAPQEAPLDFVPQRWLRVVLSPNGIDRRAWELCLLYQLRQALRSGDITVEGSHHYAPWTADLYTSAEWREQRADWYASRGLPEQGEDYLAQARADLHALTISAAERLPNHPTIQVAAGHLLFSSQDRLQMPADTAALRRALAALLPRVGLPQLLQEVDRWTSFTTAFDHLTARREPTQEHQEAIRSALLAVLVAEATNIGLTAMSSASSIPYGQLVRAYDWYLREETLQQAIRMLIAFHQSLPLTSAFGSGVSSSSHESEFARLVSGPQAQLRAACGASSRKVTMHSHLSDQAMQFWVDLVNPLAQDAPYALDGLIAQHLLPIREHIANVPGGSDLLFGLCELLGYRLIVPPQDMQDQSLTRAQEGASYGPLDPVLKHAIHDSVVIAQWDAMNRLAASLKEQRTRPSVLLPKLQSMHEATALQQALQEMGRIARTRATLTFITDPAQLQRVLAAQHRGAALDALARAVFFGQQGRLSDRDPSAQLRRALALSVVINAIIVWNTHYLEVAAQESARRGQPIPANMWPHLHPILWEHIHLVGEYLFDHMNLPDEADKINQPECHENGHSG